MNQRQSQMLPLGSLLQEGRYRVERYISSSGIGNIYEVVYTRSGKHMAMKEFFMRGINLCEGLTVTVALEENRGMFEMMRDRFIREAQRLASLESPHIVAVNDFFEENGTAYYVMQFIDGESLYATMETTGLPFSEQQVRSILPQVLSALKTIHAHGLYYLNLKPANIIRNALGHCWLIDFGASKQMSNSDIGLATTSSALCYTRGFSPYEQVNNDMKHLGPWTDFYALGATIYNLLTHQWPPDMEDVGLDGESAFSFPTSISLQMRGLILSLMQPDIRKRPQSVEEIENLLADTSSEETKLSVNGATSEQTVIHRQISNETIRSTSEEDGVVQISVDGQRNSQSSLLLPIGTLLQNGRYRIERHIASGGFGNTYQVMHIQLGKCMALKEFFKRGVNLRVGTNVSLITEDDRYVFEQMRNKFYKEAQRIACLEDPHIIEVSDSFEENETAYYVMKLIDGESLAAALATMKKTERHPFPEKEIMRILPQVLSALKTIHAQGIYHLDLKPDNIMRNAQGHCWLIDFGASKQMSSAASQMFTANTGLCFTPGYAPSEQISGNVKRIGPWTDFYALGATIYNLLTGEQPPMIDDVKYDGASAFHFPSVVSLEMQQFVRWLMQPDYPQRPKSVEEIEQRLKVSIR